MTTELEFWQFIALRLQKGESVMLLIVAESSGSSPGRQGYKMAVAADGELSGSVGGGVMEVSLVEDCRAVLSEPGAIATGFSNAILKEQVHQKNAPNSSGMICSGRQTIIVKPLTTNDHEKVNAIVDALENKILARLTVSNDNFTVGPSKVDTPNNGDHFHKESNTEFTYYENLGSKNELFVIGGGHCALALSELAARLDFRISILDDRPSLNTLEKNRFADEITIIDGYEHINEHVPDGPDVYVVVMTLGYKFDAIVVRQLSGRQFRYFGVLGSKAKMATLLRELRAEGIDPEWLGSIRTPIGLPINSRTPEEIAVSIAAEIIAVKNS